MDPDANLTELRRLAESIIAGIDDGHYDGLEGEVDRLAELVLALDSWLLQGGAFPKAWTAPRGAHPKGMNWLRR